MTHLKEVSLARISAVCQLAPPNPSSSDLLYQLKTLHQFYPSLTGGALYDSTGQRVGEFGDPPPFSFGDIHQQAFMDIHRNGRYEMVLTSDLSSKDVNLVASVEAAAARKELYAFAFRIAGLVIIISIFVTVGAWIALNPIVVTPILKLRKDLINAGDAVREDKPVPKFYSSSIHRTDELGEVISAFTKMFQQITDAISERKKAEELIQESLRQVQQYSTALNNELEQGRKMQKNFFPSRLPEKPGWEFRAFFKPARQVAGDFYDVFELPGNQVGIVIADVCDKGVGAALFMALFRSLIRIFSGQTILRGVDLPNNHHSNPGPKDQSSMNTDESHQQNALEAVRLTNNYIVQNHGDLGMFATLFFGVLDTSSGRLAYINGGHEPLYVIGNSGEIKRLDSNGPAVGVIADHPFQVDQIVLNPGNILVGYTDGITEARSSDGQLYTKRRLEAVFDQPAASAQDLLDKINTSLSAHTKNAEQEDDVTLFAIQKTDLND
jgi:serine phosphatase RsbU (regulator of sigma subunit)